MLVSESERNVAVQPGTTAPQANVFIEASLHSEATAPPGDRRQAVRPAVELARSRSPCQRSLRDSRRRAGGRRKFSCENAELTPTSATSEATVTSPSRLRRFLALAWRSVAAGAVVSPSA